MMKKETINFIALIRMTRKTYFRNMDGIVLCCISKVFRTVPFRDKYYKRTHIFMLLRSYKCKYIIHHVTTRTKNILSLDEREV